MLPCPVYMVLHCMDKSIMNRLAVYSYLTRYTYGHTGSGRPSLTFAMAPVSMQYILKMRYRTRQKVTDKYRMLVWPIDRSLWDNHSVDQKKHSSTQLVMAMERALLWSALMSLVDPYWWPLTFCIAVAVNILTSPKVFRNANQQEQEQLAWWSWWQQWERTKKPGQLRQPHGRQ